MLVKLDHLPPNRNEHKTDSIPPPRHTCYTCSEGLSPSQQPRGFDLLASLGNFTYMSLKLIPLPDSIQFEKQKQLQRNTCPKM